MVLCNNEMAIPAMQQLHMNGVLHAVVVPEKNRALGAMLQQLLAGSGVSLFTINRKNLEAGLKKIIPEKNISACWLMTFPYIIPRSLLGLLPGGFLNFHYGLLPQYRGSNPVLAQMINGETHGGITVHIVDEHVDTGAIVMQRKIAIEERDTFGIQLQKLGMLGAAMAIDLVKICMLHPIPPSIPQDVTLARYHEKPVAADITINWNRMNSAQVIRLINACNPWNKGAGAIINNMIICITDAELVEEPYPGNARAGTIINLDPGNGLTVVCADGKLIRINIICTPEGFFPGKRLADYGIKTYDQFLSPN